MRTSKYLLITALASLIFMGCHKEEPEPEPKIVYTTLSEMALKTASSSTDFDIHIKNLVVSGVFNNYVQFEDGTAGAQLNKTGHTFKVGQTFNGHITGKFRVSSGVVTFSELNTKEATVGQTTNIPCTTATLAEINADKTKFAHRRVKLQNITFVNGFKGKAGGSGTISQKGVQISATCRPDGFSVPDGAQGDLICYPAAGSCYVFDAKDFNEHEIESAITVKRNFGIYSVENDTATEAFVYKPIDDQYSYSKDDSNYSFCIQNYDKERCLIITYPTRFKAGQVIVFKSEAIGNVSAPLGEITATVEKIGTDRLWLMDYASGKGYVLYFEKGE